MMKRLQMILWLLIPLMPVMTAHAQQAEAYQTEALKVGQPCPDFSLGPLLNHPGGRAKLSDFKGKLVIFDFWDIYCSSCIKAFPELEALQAQFKDRLQLILVTRDQQESVKNLFARSKPARTSLPVMTDDTTLIKYFPVKMPHHAWIDPQGQVFAITNVWNATPANVQAVLNGERKGFDPVSLIEGFDSTRPLFATSPRAFEQAVLQYSYFTGFINGITASSPFDTDSLSGRIIRRAFYNAPALNLFKLAYGGFDGSENRFGQPGDMRRIVLQVRDSSAWIAPEDPGRYDTWRRQHTYCYETRVPPEQAGQLPRLMQQDLCRFFHVKTSIGKRKMKAYVLTRTDRAAIPAPKGGPANLLYGRNGIYELRNQPMKMLAELLSVYLPLPVSDQTAYSGTADIRIPESAMKDPARINEALNPYGLKLEASEAFFDVLVLKDDNL